MTTFFCDTTMAQEVCYKCGIIFWVPEEYAKNLRERGTNFWCPNGHEQHYTQSEVTRLKNENARLISRLDQQIAKTREVDGQRRLTERRLNATKGVVTRVKNRIASGTCPCCDEKFPDLHKHMTDAHPEYEKADDAE